MRNRNMQRIVEVSSPGAFDHDRCWVRRQAYDGTVRGQMGGAFYQCSRMARRGKRTCWQHDEYEERAQKLTRKKGLGT